ncbi:MAG: hypothetical protein ABFD07_19655 [Methanobacterium sp.]
MTKPHYAQINFNIDDFPMEQDGTLDFDNKLTNLDLQNFGISNKASFGVSGYDKEDCIRKLLEVLSKLNNG